MFGLASEHPFGHRQGSEHFEKCEDVCAGGIDEDI